MNINNVDYMVEEFLLYRGFTQTFRCLENEKSHDRARSFQENKIVEQIFQYLINFEVESFIALWDFLLKRFFLHLDQEHLEMIGSLKADLLKYYLVNAIKSNNRNKAHEFFATYSHEILTEAGDSLTHSFRSWYVIVYLEQPEKDPQFAPYFIPRWAECLRLALNNFLSVVLSAAPPPKLLLLERWNRSDAQQELRSSLRTLTQENAVLLDKAKQYERRIEALHTVVLELSTQLLRQTSVNAAYAHHRGASAGDATAGDGDNPDLTRGQGDDGAAVGSGGRRGGRYSSTINSSLFDVDESELEAHRQKVRTLGQSICKLGGDCVRRDQKLLALVGGSSGSSTGKSATGGSGPGFNGSSGSSLRGSESGSGVGRYRTGGSGSSGTAGDVPPPPPESAEVTLANEKMFKDIILGKAKLGNNGSSSSGAGGGGRGGSKYAQQRREQLGEYYTAGVGAGAGSGSAGSVFENTTTVEEVEHVLVLQLQSWLELMKVNH